MYKHEHSFLSVHHALNNNHLNDIIICTYLNAHTWIHWNSKWVSEEIFASFPPSPRKRPVLFHLTIKLLSFFISLSLSSIIQPCFLFLLRLCHLERFFFSLTGGLHSTWSYRSSLFNWFILFSLSRLSYKVLDSFSLGTFDRLRWL